MTEPVDELFDQRYHRRVSASGQARINYGGRWHVCQIVDLSGGGGRFRAQIKPVLGTNVLVQLRGVGMVRARVVNRNHGSFALAFNQKDYDVDTMVDNLMLAANAQLLAGKTLPEPSDELEGEDEQTGDEADEGGESRKRPKGGMGSRLRSIIGK